MADTVLNEHKQDISEFVIVPSDGGRFEITVDDELVFSKLKEGRFPEDSEVLAHL